MNMVGNLLSQTITFTLLNLLNNRLFDSYLL